MEESLSRKKNNITFIVAKSSSELNNYAKKDILFVDGSLKGYKAYDHHITGEKINLDAMPPLIENRPNIVATTQIDSDAICSAVVAYFGGERNIKKTYIDIFRCASMFCDYLIPNENFDQETNQKGLGFHLYLKEKGFTLSKKYPEVGFNERSEVFSTLCDDIIEVIKNNKKLPNDTSYLNRIMEQQRLAKTYIVYEDDLITVLLAKTFIDPIASYKIVKTPILVVSSEIDNGLYKHSIGVNPKYYDKYNIKKLLTLLDKEYEEGWGGRNIAGGGPFNGSELSIDELVKIIQNNKNKIKVRSSP
jgi:hypothetical protein